jgi:endonuclease V-like protein UPF0215 family
LTARLHINKVGIRVLGVAESFSKSDKKSVLGCVVMRGDLVIDGIVIGSATVGGDDATEAVLRAFKSLSRNDINAIMLSGCVLSMYNIVDVDGLAKRSRVPVVCLTYRETSGIESAIRHHFPVGAERKLAAYRSLGERKRVRLSSGKSIYIRVSGIAEPDAIALVDKFTMQGSLPEPVRVAKLLARAVRAAGSSRLG